MVRRRHGRMFTAPPACPHLHRETEASCVPSPRRSRSAHVPLAPPMSFRFTTLAHANHAVMSPISEAKLERLLEALGARDGSRVLDVGCGHGEMLVRLEGKARIEGVGIDRNPAMIEAAATRAGRLPVDRRQAISWLMADAATVTESLGVFDVVICVGATGAFGGYDGTLKALHRLLPVGGRALVGEGHWRRPPDAGYLEALGASPEEMTDFAETAARARAMNFDVLESIESTSEEWDAYEGLYADSIDRWCHEHPDDPESAAFRARIATWTNAYRRWGRDTLGFGSYVLRRRPYA